MAESSAVTLQGMNFPLQFVFPPGLVTRYVTNITVQGNEHEVIISFFEAHPPLIFEPQQLEHASSVQAECVSRIVIAPGRLAEFARLLQDAANRQPSRDSQKGAPE